jgi:integrase
MAGTVRHSKIESATARSRLKRGRQAHWRAIVTGRAHLGYQRKLDAEIGRWLLRRYVDGKYRIEALALADDNGEADGVRVLSFDQAQAKAIATIDAPTAKRERITVRQAMDDYIEHKKQQGQPTIDLVSRINAHIKPTLGDKVVSELTAERLRRWLSDLAATPAFKRTPKGKPQRYKPEPGDEEAVRRRKASANRVLSIFKAALNHAYDEGHVSNREAWGRRLKPFKGVDAPRVQFLSVAEAKRLINGCDPEFRPMAQAALNTGCRYSELTRLQIADFSTVTDLKKGTTKGTIAIRKSKSGKARHVVLTDEGIAFFRDITAARAGDELIFKRRDGSQWKASQQGRPMRYANERAKLTPAITFHGLRHTWASLAVMAGMPLLVVASNLGHADTRMVERVYGHLTRDYIDQAIHAHAPRFGFKSSKKVVALRR